MDRVVELLHWWGYRTPVYRNQWATLTRNVWLRVCDAPEYPSDDSGDDSELRTLCVTSHPAPAALASSSWSSWCWMGPEEVEMQCIRFAKLPAALATVREMLLDREYAVRLVDPSAPHAMEGHGRDGVEVLVFYLPEVVKVGIKGVRASVEVAKERNASHIVLVCQSGGTPYAAKEIDDAIDGVSVEIFPTKELQMNITKHELYFPHRRLHADELATLTKWVKETEFPLQLTSDPVARYFRFQPGDVIEILRRYKWAGLVKYYRRVVQNKGTQ